MFFRPIVSQNKHQQQDKHKAAYNGFQISKLDLERIIDKKGMIEQKAQLSLG